RFHHDPRAQLESRIHDSQLSYSLMQLRLVGALLLLLLLGRLLVALITGLQASAIERLSALGALANWLPLLPLAISLVLLGGGRQRLRFEPPLTIALHRSLLPLALAVLLLLPGAILLELGHAHSQGIATLSPYQLEVLSPMRTATAIVLSLIAGLGLILLQRQGSAAMRRQGCTPALFFRTDNARRPVGHRHLGRVTG
ncbi:MAG: hypothetical protein ACKOPN_11370, partial [Prochlorococcaceae cyanobacterium]